MPMTLGKTDSDARMSSDAIKGEASRLGFDLVGVAPAVTPEGIHRFLDWLERGMAGGMEYLPRREAAYRHPRHVLDGVRSIVVLGMNYAAPHNHECAEPRRTAPVPAAPDSAISARVARYAQGRADYHDLLRERLDDLARFVQERRPESRTRGVVDTAPLLERDFARLAGLGWFGKNTMLINKRLGSWFFLAALLTDIELDYDAPHVAAHCGTCTRCLDACPTGAFPEPYVLDARRCISYLTIEHRGPIGIDLREGIGEWLFGCDICQEVCPWNRMAPLTDEPAFQPRADLDPADAASVLLLEPTEFRRRFGDTPLARPKRAGLLRNAAIVLGNRRDPSGLPALIGALSDAEPVVRGAAVWALGRFSEESARQALRERQVVEDDPAVRGEISAALSESRLEDSHACPI